MDYELLTQLSPAVQRDLSLALLSQTVLHFPLFKGAKRSFVAELAQAHVWVECLKDDLVAEDGQILQEVVFVIDGCLRAYAGRNERLEFRMDSPVGHFSENYESTHRDFVSETCLSEDGSFIKPKCTDKNMELKSGAWFGEACLFDRDRIRTSTVIAMDQCELAVLQADEYQHVIWKYPMVLKRHKEIEQSFASGRLNLDDLAYKPRNSVHAEKNNGKFHLFDFGRKHCDRRISMKVAPKPLRFIDFSSISAAKHG